MNTLFTALARWVGRAELISYIASDEIIYTLIMGVLLGALLY